MSISLQVFLFADRLPTSRGWANAIRSHGFELEMDPDFDLRTFVGFLPCRYRGEETGFEYFFNEIGPDDDVDPEQIGERDAVVSFVTHSDIRGLASSTVASYVLCA